MRPKADVKNGRTTLHNVFSKSSNFSANLFLKNIYFSEKDTHSPFMVPCGCQLRYIRMGFGVKDEECIEVANTLQKAKHLFAFEEIVSIFLEKDLNLNNYDQICNYGGENLFFTQNQKQEIVKIRVYNFEGTWRFNGYMCGKDQNLSDYNFFYKNDA